MVVDKTLFTEYGQIRPSCHERTFGLEEVIVSKTDLKGHITYANEVFCRVAGYSREELLGAPHKIVRHPDMPRCVFKLLWDTISQGDEIFAYVKNMARTGDYYWVFAHVTPTFGSDGKIIGYHSNRRSPNRNAVQFFDRLYASLLSIEMKTDDRKRGLDASFQAVLDLLSEKGITYEQLVFSVT